MKIRVMSGALIRCEDDVLMMKRAEMRKIAPGMWAGVGGHSEPHEINDPKITCLREVYEETGLHEKDLEKLELKYIIFRKSADEITLIYYFIGSTTRRNFIDKTNEGKLHWINQNELLGRQMSFEIRNIIEHCLENGFEGEIVNVGTVSVQNEKPIMSWTNLDCWGGLI